MTHFAFGGIFTDAISGAVAVVLGFTGIFGGIAFGARSRDRRCDVIYTGPMAIRVALIAIPAATIAGLVVLLNSLDASPGIAVAALMLVAALSGGAFGYFADRLPELPRPRHSAHPLVLHRID